MFIDIFAVLFVLFVAGYIFWSEHQWQKNWKNKHHSWRAVDQTLDERKAIRQKIFEVRDDNLYLKLLDEFDQVSFDMHKNFLTAGNKNGYSLYSERIQELLGVK